MHALLQRVISLIAYTRLTSTLSPYKLSLWFSLLKTWAGYLFLALQAMSSASMSIILSSGIPSRLTVLGDKSNGKFSINEYQERWSQNIKKQESNLLTDTRIKY